MTNEGTGVKITVILITLRFQLVSWKIKCRSKTIAAFIDRKKDITFYFHLTFSTIDFIIDEKNVTSVESGMTEFCLFHNKRISPIHVFFINNLAIQWWRLWNIFYIDGGLWKLWYIVCSTHLVTINYSLNSDTSLITVNVIIIIINIPIYKFNMRSRSFFNEVLLSIIF